MTDVNTIAENDTHYFIYSGDGVFMQRKHEMSASDNPITFQEEIIIELCKRLTKAETILREFNEARTLQP